MPLSQIHDAWQRPTKTSTVASPLRVPMDISWLVGIDDYVSALHWRVAIAACM